MRENEEAPLNARPMPGMRGYSQSDGLAEEAVEDKNAWDAKHGRPTARAPRLACFWEQACAAS